MNIRITYRASGEEDQVITIKRYTQYRVARNIIAEIVKDSINFVNYPVNISMTIEDLDASPR